MRRMRMRAVESQRGSALVLTLVMVVVLALLGAALLELSTLEGVLVRGDVADLQAFNCAEYVLTQTYKTKARTDAIATLGTGATLIYYGVDVNNAVASPGTNLQTVGRSYAVQVTASGGATPLVRATCTEPSGRTRTVQVGLQYPNAIYEYALVSGGTSPGTGNGYLGGSGSPIHTGDGNYPGGADTVIGDIYVAGKMDLRGAPVLQPCHSADCDPSNLNPQITALGGLHNTSTFDQTAAGAYGTTGLNPMPNVQTQVMDPIQAAVTDGSGNRMMTGIYNGSTVYNLTKIFQTLGATSEGNIERNLARPGGCTYGSPSSDPNCQIWQELLYVGIKKTSANPGPQDAPGYYFMGIPRSPSQSPQNTSFNNIYYKLVNASDELKQMGFTPGTGSNMGNLGARMDTLVGPDTAGFSGNSDENLSRLVDFTATTNPSGTTVMRSKPPIFYIEDGYFRADDAPGYVYNGMATVVTTKSVILSANIFYLNGTDNKNLALPSSGVCPNGSTDRAGCGLADVLGLVAKDDIWVGDAGASGATVHRVSAVMMAGRDANYLGYNSSSACCQGVSNEVTLTGTVMAARNVELARDWADRTNPAAPCNSASTASCRPVALFSNDTSCGDANGCWRFLKIDTTSGSPTFGALIVDTAYAAFKGGCEPTPSNSNYTCADSGQRRITHFQLNVNYEKRLWQNSGLIPPGLPTGSSTLPPIPKAGTWKDCGQNTTCA